MAVDDNGLRKITHGRECQWPSVVALDSVITVNFRGNGHTMTTIDAASHGDAVARHGIEYVTSQSLRRQRNEK